MCSQTPVGRCIFLQGDTFYTLHLMCDVNPYYYQIIRSALDHKKENEYSVMCFLKICL